MDALNTLHHWLARGRIFVIIIVAIAIVRASRLWLHIPETSFSIPIVAFVASYGAYLIATCIRDAYDARHEPKGPSDEEVAANVERLLADARAAIERKRL